MFKVYGPYTRKDGRKHVIHYDGQTRRTQSYPRYLMEQYLGRPLLDTEHVDHINNNYTDDRIENFQLLTQTANNKKSAKPSPKIKLECINCHKTFYRKMRTYKQNQSVKKADGPFCSKQCVGKMYH